MAVISKIEPSHFDAGTAYICVDFHLMDNRDPCIYKTTDFGKTWTKINGNLPTRHPLDLRARDRRESEQEGHALRGHRQRAVLLAGRRPELEAASRGTAARRR